MRYLFTGKQSKELDNHAIHTVGFPGIVLMERAAMTLVSVLIEKESKQSSFLFVCGVGNNGGDGLAAARMMKQQGYDTAIVLIGNSDKLTEDAKKQLSLAAACDVPAVSSDAILSSHYTCLVDGLFGVGLSRDICGVYEKIIQDINDCGKRIYAVDIPSGINADNGKVMNVAVRADATITFGVNKLGLVLYPGCEYAGEVMIGDIGYPKQSYQSISNSAFYFEPDDLVDILPNRKPDGHKGTFGHVSIIGGCESMSGAVLFSAKAAYASGAGLVKIFTVRENRDILLNGVPEILFSCYEGKDGEPNYDELDEAIQFGDVIVLGPGLGNSQRSKKIVDYMVLHCCKPIILDGDGITLCEQESINGKKNIVFTPHPKEFSSLTGIPIHEYKADIISEAKRFSEDTGCVLIAKDARTIVSDGQHTYVNISGNSGMGVGGSGDVLTGIVAAFIAQGLELYQAAICGVYVHGLAGDSFQNEYNAYSLTASDLVERIKYVLCDK